MSAPSPPADVLVVDDTPANLDLVAATLRALGHHVRLARSGRDALRAARVQPPDLVLLDVDMPEMDGYEVCENLKASDELRGIPVVFLSALSQPLDKVRAFQAGGVDYVTKPFEIDELVARVATQLTVRRLQRDTEARNRELEDAGAQLREVQSIREMLSNAIVHDLRGPLAAAHANVAWLRETHDTPGEAREVLDEVAVALDVMGRMLIDLLDVARWRDGPPTVKRTPATLGALVARACTTAQLQMRVTGHELAVEVDERAEVHVDADLVVRLLENLLDNAIKYAPERSVIRVRAVLDASGTLRLRVEDGGPGVPPAYRERIFEQHARLDRDSDRMMRTGRGLGLSFCKFVAEAHGGRIWMEDAVPEGSAFCVELPAGAPQR